MAKALKKAPARHEANGEASLTRRVASADGSATLQAKFQAARREIKSGLVERDGEVDLLLTALVAREHVLLVGPPGTAKSMISDAVADLVSGSRFSVLLTKFSTPEDVVGPVSVQQLKADRYVRVTAGKLPEAEVAFIDEVFKASSAILNTLLKLLNERTFDAGDGVVRRCPLRVCLAASNEWPESREELGALFDRFLFRKVVQPVRSQAGLHRLLFGSVGGFSPSARLTAADVDAAAAEAEALPWSREAADCLLAVVAELAKQGIAPGDRRKRKAVGAARAFAWLSGASEVEARHLAVLQHVLWDDHEQAAKAGEVVLKAASPLLWAVGQAAREAEEAIAAAPDAGGDIAQQGATLVSKLTEIGKRHLERFAGEPEADECRRWLWAEIRAVRARWIDSAVNTSF